MSEREPGRFEITFVPADIRNRDRQIGVGAPVMPRYQRVTFEKDLARVDAVLTTEAALGHSAVEMPHNHPSYDIRSTRPDGRIAFIEVKGRIAGAATFTVTQNELRFAANIPDAYLLALVEVSPDGPAGDKIRYITHPYGGEVRLPFDTTSTTLDWAAYWKRGEPQPPSISSYQSV